MKISRYLAAAYRSTVSALRHDIRSRVARDSATVLTGHLARLALGLISSALLARGLGPEGLGEFSVIGAAMAVAITVADFGLSNSAIRHVAHDMAAHAERAQRMAQSYARLKLLAALATAVTLFALATPIGHLLNLAPGAARLWVGLLSLGLVMTATSGLATTLLQALRRFRAVVATQLLNICLTIALLGGLFVIGRLTVATALLVGAVAAGAAAGLGIRLLPPRWRPHPSPASGAINAERRRLVAFSRWLWVSAIFSILVSQLDLLLLNRWSAPHVVGLYALALNLALKTDVINQTLQTVLLPTASALTTHAAYARYVRTGLVRSFILSIPLLVVLPLARPFITLVYGAGYVGAVNVFYLLLLVTLFDLFTVPPLLLAFPLGLARAIAGADIVRVAVLLFVGALLIPTWGMVGAVVAKLAAKAAGAVVLGAAIAGSFGSSEASDGVPPGAGTAPAPGPSDAMYDG